MRKRVLCKLAKSLHRIPKRWLEYAVLISVLMIFVVKSAGYLHFNALSPSSVKAIARTNYMAVQKQIGELKYFGKCQGGMIKVDIGRQYLCRSSVEPSVYQKIYDTYPRNPHGREIIYSTLDTGSIDVANDFLKNQYDVPRFQPVTLKQPLVWDEDPYNDRYWRFNYYSLRIFKDLLYAADITGDPKYAERLLNTVNSFLDTGMNQPHAWDDYHAVAWRAMMLTDTWWKLRQINALPVDTSNKMLVAIEKHAEFLAEPGHYESQFNHGTNEAAALYLLGVSFPDLPNASRWLDVGKQRLGATFDDLIDSDGALVEHSSYYHFYVMEKYWEIERYATAQHKQISSEFDQKIRDMVRYATYILQPNLHVPIVGASLDRQIHDSGEFAEMANMDPEFRYVMTKGKSGNKPSNNVQFKNTGQTIMRSGWNPDNYTQQTQVIFNYGAYSTQHSHLDTLSFELYGAGISLLPGPGLYSYNRGPLYDYFTGTSASNTVMVDNMDQQPGTGVVGQYIDKGDYVSQSASAQLNQGVTHERQVTLIGGKVVVIVDMLHSAEEHTYQQLFHLFPGAEYSHDGLAVIAQGEKPQQRLEINQLMTDGVDLSDVYDVRDPAHIGGICSEQYEKLVPCRQVVYSKKSKDATFVTVLKIGKPDNTIYYQLVDNKTIEVQESNKTYALKIDESPGKDTSVTPTDNSEVAKPYDTQFASTDGPLDWQTSGGVLDLATDTYLAGQKTLTLTSNKGQVAVAKKQVSLNLSDKNILIHIKVPEVKDIKDLDLLLYSDGSSYAQNRLMNSYKVMHNDEWLTISLGKGRERDQQGQWSIYGDGFDWSSIQAVAFRLSSEDGGPIRLLFGALSTFPGQNEGKVVMVFDDGYSSIKPAADVLDKYGFKASVAIIGMYPARKQSGYLSVSDIKNLRDRGWSIINHTYFHKDAIAEYYNKNSLENYEKDILMGAMFLSQNGLSTDENWLIVPHGASNIYTEDITGKYYKFVRLTLQAPEVYPFGDPKLVKTFGVQNDTPTSAVKKAIDDANTYHQTLFLTFHRIYSTSTDKPGYDISKFSQIADYLATTKSQVMSLNQLDDSNGVAQNYLRIEQGYPAQLITSISVKRPFLLRKFMSSFLNFRTMLRRSTIGE